MDAAALTDEQRDRIWRRIKDSLMMDMTEPEIEKDDSAAFAPILLSQEEAGYVVPAPGEEVCAGCRFYGGEGMCHIVANYPAVIAPNGYCTWHDGVPMPEDAPPLEVVIVEGESDNVDKQENQDYNTRKAANWRAWFKRKSAIEKEVQRLTETGSAFKALGNGLWMATHTNNFEDRDKEILSQAAHDRYIARAQAGFVDMPDLWHWHLPGTKHGQADWIDRIGHMVYAIGHFTDDEYGKAAEAHYQKYGHLYKLSHGFRYPSWAKEDGVYQDYNTFEISTLPTGKALESNPYTEFEVFTMALDQVKKDSLTKIFGKERASEMIARVEKLEEGGKAIEELGAKFKDYADVTGTGVAAKAQAAGVASQDVSALLVDLIDVQAKVMETLPAMDKRNDKAIADLKASVEKAVKEITDKAAEFTQALADIKSYRPRSVTETPEIKDADIEDKLKQQAGVEYDPLFPGMKVPLEKNGRG